ncbi:MAG TPA: hypothetical protein VNG73_07320, partial [Gemmatimonadaceae bacterium]|nr:hypothetical protein [Gemmatimonadaceae bacterium]
MGDIVDAMVSSPLFVPGQTVISINNRTEPFLNALTTRTTIDTVKAIAKRGLGNPVCITTKMAVDDYSLSTLANTAIGKLFLCVTYSGLPKTLEPLGHRSQEQTMRSMSKVKRDGMYLFHLFRPIMQGYNDSLQVMQDVMSFAMRYADCTVYTGVKIDNEIMARLRLKGNIVDDQQMQAYKHLPRGFQVALQSIAHSGKRYPIFRHTSCAISWALQTPDYNAYWDQGKCTENCPNYHSCLPYVRVPTQSDVHHVLKRIGVEAGEAITRQAVYVNADMTL